MDIMSFALICGAVGVAYGLFTTTWVLKQDAGNPRMQEISAAIREGANAFLNRQYKTVAIVGAVVFVLLFYGCCVRLAQFPFHGWWPVVETR